MKEGQKPNCPQGCGLNADSVQLCRSDACVVLLVQIAQLEQDEKDARRLGTFMGMEINIITGRPLGAPLDSLDTAVGRSFRDANAEAEGSMRAIVLTVLTLLSTALLFVVAMQMILVDPVVGGQGLFPPPP